MRSQVGSTPQGGRGCVGAGGGGRALGGNGEQEWERPHCHGGYKGGVTDVTCLELCEALDVGADGLERSLPTQTIL